MTTLGASEETRRIVDASQAAFKGLTGSVLSFAALARLLHESDTKKLALAVEVLASKETNVLKRVYFFEDENYGLVEIAQSEVAHYVISGQFYHPITRMELDSESVDDNIIIEFEVL